MYVSAGNTGSEATRSLKSYSRPLIELRQYELREGMRDTLIDLFDRALAHGQEEVGISVIGEFRDLDDANKFVWIRGFANMAVRARALAEFYDGPLWAQHRESANATMLAASNVLLLHRAEDGAGFELPHPSDPSRVNAASTGLVEAMILTLAPAADRKKDLSFFRNVVAPALALGGGSILGYFLTETRANNFPRLPIREGLSALVWITGYPEASSSDAQQSEARRRAIGLARQAPSASRAPEILRLSPTPRSRLTGLAAPCAASAALLPPPT